MRYASERTRSKTAVIVSMRYDVHNVLIFAIMYGKYWFARVCVCARVSLCSFNMRLLIGDLICLNVCESAECV